VDLFHWNFFVKSFLSTEFGDNCVLINDHVSCIRNILATGSQTIIVFRSFNQEQSLFTYPCDSALLGIRVVSDLAMRCNTCSVSCVTNATFVLLRLYVSSMQMVHVQLLPSFSFRSFPIKL
jgi:hypothetical protein